MPPTSSKLTSIRVIYLVIKNRDILQFAEEEKEAIKMIFGNAVNLLSEEDRRLPQIKGVLPYLLRGIGIHHSGQLPIMKEIVEILFGEGLIKVRKPF